MASKSVVKISIYIIQLTECLPYRIIEEMLLISCSCINNNFKQLFLSYHIYLTTVNIYLESFSY